MLIRWSVLRSTSSSLNRAITVTTKSRANPNGCHWTNSTWTHVETISLSCQSIMWIIHNDKILWTQSCYNFSTSWQQDVPHRLQKWGLFVGWLRSSTKPNSPTMDGWMDGGMATNTGHPQVLQKGGTTSNQANATTCHARGLFWQMTLLLYGDHNWTSAPRKPEKKKSRATG